MHDVSNAINILDPNKDTIDKAICKDRNTSQENTDKCWSGKGNAQTLGTGLANMFKPDESNNLYPEDKDKKMSTYPQTYAKISSDVSNLTKDQKGIVSSAFAKAATSSNNTRLSKIYINDVYPIRGVKRGDGDEEGIYLLAKDLAYYVALNRTNELTAGIQKMQQKQLWSVNEEINHHDKQIQGEICKNAYQNTQANEAEGKCGTGHSSNSSSNKTGLDDLWVGGTSTNRGGGYDKTGTDPIGPITSGRIARDTASLTREQHGVVSSAFAKAATSSNNTRKSKMYINDVYLIMMYILL